jgi:F0F1-type ATP synthase assembly protein I
MNPKKSKKQLLFNYAKYSSMAIQMLVIILLGVFAGYKIDHWLHMKVPVFIIVFSIVAVMGAIFYVTKDLLNKK